MVCATAGRRRGAGIRPRPAARHGSGPAAAGGPVPGHHARPMAARRRGGAVAADGRRAGARGGADGAKREQEAAAAAPAGRGAGGVAHGRPACPAGLCCSPKQLCAVQERISIMAALQQWSEPQAAAAPPAAAAAQEEAGSGAEGEGGGQPGGAAAPTRASPASSSGGSGELVERPEYDEEVEKADAGTARSEAATQPGGPASEGAGRGRAGSQGAFGGQPKSGARVAEPADPALATLAKYAQLGEK